MSVSGAVDAGREGWAVEGLWRRDCRRDGVVRAVWRSILLRGREVSGGLWVLGLVIENWPRGVGLHVRHIL